MKNILNYYYNLNLLEVFNLEGKYYFNINGNSYFFIPFERSIGDLKSINNLCNEIKKRNILTNTIEMNKYNQLFTMVDEIPYVLIKDNSRKTLININDILYIQNNSLNISNDIKLYRNDWIKMWEIKIDYYESQTNNSFSKYPLLRQTLDYYIGLGENAISYLVNNNINIKNVVLSHRRINSNCTSFDFYNPINYIIDNRVRDFAEYIKSIFFEVGITSDIFNNYLNNFNFTRDEYILLIARLLFPTYYFDKYDEIVNNRLDESIIKNVLNKNNEYIIFLKNTLYYIIYTKKINIPFIDWIFRYPNL